LSCCALPGATPGYECATATPAWHVSSARATGRSSHTRHADRAVFIEGTISSISFVKDVMVSFLLFPAVSSPLRRSSQCRPFPAFAQHHHQRSVENHAGPGFHARLVSLGTCRACRLTCHLCFRSLSSPAPVTSSTMIFTRSTSVICHATLATLCGVSFLTIAAVPVCT
jgi:hypothetical protein